MFQFAKSSQATKCGSISNPSVSTGQDSFDAIDFINLSLINSMTNSFFINTSLSQIVPLRPKDQEYIHPP